jgi:MYXO-CTERM domain-containing protein
MARTCQGDSGGPALDADGKLLGVLSRGPQGCLSSIFGDVGAWGDFIIETAIEAAEMGGYPAPFWTAGSSVPPVAGDPCGGDCGLGLLCDMEAGADEGECVPGCLERGACKTDLECDLETEECVPACAEEGDCPEDLACDVENGTCVDPASLIDPDANNTVGATDTASDGGCSVNGGSDSENTWGWLAALAALGVAGVGRRRINRTR